MLWRGYLGSSDALKWPELLWRGGRCRQVKTRVNVWTVRRDTKSCRCGEVAVSGGSTVFYNALVAKFCPVNSTVECNVEAV